MAENQIQKPLVSCGDMNRIGWKYSVPESSGILAG